MQRIHSDNIECGKTVFFVGQMDLSGLYENEFLEDYDESNVHSWEKTVEVFTKKYDR